MQQTTQHQQRNNLNALSYRDMCNNNIHCSIEKNSRVYLPARNTNGEYDNVIRYECRDSE